MNNKSKKSITSSCKVNTRQYYQVKVSSYSKIYNQEINELENVTERLKKMKKNSKNDYSSFYSLVNY